jgi:hypothetical protein
MERSFSRFFYFLLIVVMALLALTILLLSAGIFKGPLAARILFSGIDVLAILMFLVFASAAKEVKEEASGKPLGGFSKSPRYWLLAATGLLLVMTGYCLIQLHVDQITPENYERIREGMTIEEVQAIIGAPPGNCSKRFWKQQPPTVVGNIIGDHRKGQPFFWMGDKGRIVVVLDQNGKVTQKEFNEAPQEPSSKVIRQILNWLMGAY